MKLEKLINEINVIELRGDISKEVSGIQIDSRKVEKGHLFVAVKGTQTDVGTSECYVQPGSVRILDSQGNDVTRNYDIVIRKGTLTVLSPDP